MNSDMYPSAADNIRMERHSVARHAMQILLGDHPGLSREDVQHHAAQIMLDSLHKQARWSESLDAEA